MRFNSIIRLKYVLTLNLSFRDVRFGRGRWSLEGIKSHETACLWLEKVSTYCRSSVFELYPDVLFIWLRRPWLQPVIQVHHAYVVWNIACKAQSAIFDGSYTKCVYKSSTETFEWTNSQLVLRVAVIWIKCLLPMLPWLSSYQIFLYVDHETIFRAHLSVSLKL